VLNRLPGTTLHCLQEEAIGKDKVALFHVLQQEVCLSASSLLLAVAQTTATGGIYGL